jgi:hypothetical protein
MTQSLADDARLRAAEAQMRRALGLQNAAPRSGDEYRPTPTTATHRPPRRFVRDGEVPVTVVHRGHHRDDATSTNHLDPIRQALTEQMAANGMPSDCWNRRRPRSATFRPSWPRSVSARTNCCRLSSRRSTRSRQLCRDWKQSRRNWRLSVPHARRPRMPLPSLWSGH